MPKGHGDNVITAVSLSFGQRGVYLNNDEPLSVEEAEEIRDALSRYLESELPYTMKDGRVCPALNAAYDRFIDWAVETSNPTSDGGWSDQMYADHKKRRESRIRTETGKLSRSVPGKALKVSEN
jgi:hypothetical protein